MDRQIDGLGRVVIPKDIRTQLSIKPDDYLEVSVENEAIVLRPKKKTVLDIRRMTIVNIDQDKVNTLKQKYLKGDKVRLLNMESEHNIIPRGTIGTVVGVDDVGSVHIKWENNNQIIAVLNIPGDSIEKI